uniref:RteC domain-containing protein n=1 Tax=Gelidibacter sp. TaxID=2018083 RepID=UPI00404A5DF1
MTLEHRINNILEEYKDAIKHIEELDLNEFSVVENGISITRKFIQTLRTLVREGEFKSKELEISFFKYQKPFIYGRMKFYAKLYNFLLERPAGSIKSQRIFIDEKINRLQSDNLKNLDFIKYYRENSTTLDEFYFLRGNDNISLVSDTSHFYTDKEFSTSHDNAVAKIMAYDLLINHYNTELVKLGQALEKNKTATNGVCSEINLEWTASKTDLVELIYALQASGAIKDGRAAIKDMATACEQMFNTDLGNFYKTYVEIKARKMDRTNFINLLKTSFEHKMNVDDNNF